MALACPAIRGNFLPSVNYLTPLNRFLSDAAFDGGRIGAFIRRMPVKEKRRSFSAVPSDVFVIHDLHSERSSKRTRSNGFSLIPLTALPRRTAPSFLLPSWPALRRQCKTRSTRSLPPSGARKRRYALARTRTTFSLANGPMVL